MFKKQSGIDLLAWVGNIRAFIEPKTENTPSTKPKAKGGRLGSIERIGNHLPDPATLFLIGTALVMIASAVAAKAPWVVEERLPEQPTALGQAGDGFSRIRVVFSRG